MAIDINKVYYFASPYSHPDEDVREARYFEQQRLVALLTIFEGASLISPIEMCHNMSKAHKMPTGYEYWKNRDRKFIKISDGIIVALMPGWKESIGVQDELAYARELGKEVLFMDPITLQLMSEVPSD